LLLMEGVIKKPILRSKIGALGKPKTKRISVANPRPFAKQKRGLE
jgi:hypothetical protein